jgi:hypothetical protein
MIKLFEYALKQMESPMKDIFLRVLIRMALKKVARTTASRAHNIRILNVIDMLAVALPAEEGKQMLDKLLAINETFTRSHASSSLRIALILSLIKEHRCDQSNNMAPVLNGFYDRFSNANALSWLSDIAASLNLRMAECRHFYEPGGERYMMGSMESHLGHRLICSHCASHEVASGAYIRHGGRNELYVAQYCVQIHSSGNDVYWGDSRNDGVTFNVQRDMWVDRRWNPYGNIINAYHSSRGQGFHVIDSPWYRSNRRAFGCELEIQVRDGNKDAAAGKIHEVLNPSLRLGEYCFFERDGSIGEGFEIVTQPAGLDVHRDKLALFLNSKELKKGLRSHEGGACGFHVHVGRDFLTQGQIFRIQAFLNDVRNEQLIRSVARRYGNGYVQYKPDLSKFTAKGKLSRERYEALNVCNADTVEFRIFRGSLRYESMMSALEFVNAICTFCTPGVASLREFNTLGFKEFLLQPEQRAETKFLRAYLSIDDERDNEIAAAA